MAAKYDTSVGIEGEFEPGSNGAVLKNLKGITTKAAMDEQEILSLIEVQERYLEAVILGYECNYNALAAFFREALERATKA